jgi:hypothetical protein
MSDTDNFELVWNKTIDYGSYIRKNMLNELENWNILQKLFEKLTNIIEWNDDVIDRYDFMINELGLVEYEEELNIENKEDRKHVWELQFLYLQHGRIPKNNQISSHILKLFQIAYNVGMLRVEMENPANNGIYSDELKDYYYQNKLYTYESYIDKNQIREINYDLLENDTVFSDIIDGLEIPEITKSDQEIQDEKEEEESEESVTETEQSEETYASDVMEGRFYKPNSQNDRIDHRIHMGRRRRYLKGGNNIKSKYEYKYKKYQYKNQNNI